MQGKSKTKFLVTGSAGLVGRQVVKELKTRSKQSTIKF